MVANGTSQMLRFGGAERYRCARFQAAGWLGTVLLPAAVLRKFIWIAGLALVANGQDQYGVLLGDKPIQRYIACTSTRDHQFPVTMSERSANQGMVGQDIYGGCDQVYGFKSLRRISFTQKVGQPLQIA